MKKKVLMFFAVLVLFSSMVACGPAEYQQQSTGGAQQVTDLGFQIPKNAQGNTSEQQNIIDRLKVTTDPTKVLWIHLITLDGKIILRTPVSHKITSSGKRLEPITAGSSNEYGFNLPHFTINGTTYETVEIMQPDGTYGSSDNYVYWFDPQHRYYQWGTAGGLGYLLTDFPIDLTNPQDLVTGMYNTDITAFQWQQVQEKTMRDQATKDCQTAGLTYNPDTGGCK